MWQDCPAGHTANTDVAQHTPDVLDKRLTPQFIVMAAAKIVYPLHALHSRNSWRVRIFVGSQTYLVFDSKILMWTQ